MGSSILPLLVTLFFNLVLASLLDLHAIPGSPCAPICDAAKQDGAFICKDGDIGGAGLEGCLTCLQGGRYVDGEDDEYLANRRFQTTLSLTRIQRKSEGIQQKD